MRNRNYLCILLFLSNGIIIIKLISGRYLESKEGLAWSERSLKNRKKKLKTKAFQTRKYDQSLDKAQLKRIQ